MALTLGVLPLLAPGNPADGRPPAAGAGLQDEAKRIAETIRALPEDLAGDEAKARFRSSLVRILAARARVQPNGYEDGAEFRERTRKVLAALGEQLRRDLPRPDDEGAHTLARDLAANYERNEANFAEFSKRALDGEDAATREEGLKTLVRAATLLYFGNREVYNQAIEWTFVWPFSCGKALTR